MRLCSFLGLFLACSFLLIQSPKTALSQGHAAFCQKADSTAASQACIKRHFDSAQRRLNKAYQNLNNELKGEDLETLKELQKTWLAYRDAECMWEAGRSEAVSAKLIGELSCMARVTEDRADILTIAHSEGAEEGMRQEFGGFPRWMNVLSKDHANVSWLYGAREGYDLDCDGEDEYVMQGYVTAPHDVKKNAAEGEAIEGETVPQVFTKDIAVAVVTNPIAGRPNAALFSFPVVEEESENGVCGSAIDINFIQKGDADSCQSYLEIKDKGCASKFIQWSGKEFALTAQEDLKKPAEETAEETEEQK